MGQFNPTSLLYSITNTRQRWSFFVFLLLDLNLENYGKSVLKWMKHIYQSSESNERCRIETLKRLLKRVRRVPLEIADQLSIVEIALEHNQAGLGQAGEQFWIGGFHLAGKQISGRQIKYGIRTESFFKNRLSAIYNVVSFIIIL